MNLMLDFAVVAGFLLVVTAVLLVTHCYVCRSVDDDDRDS